MRAWRLVPKRWAKDAFSGEGARLFGGRWNPRGVPLVYCAEHLSLAALEQLVHVEAEDAPDCVAFAVDVPESVQVEELRPADLPREWRADPPPASLADLGARWVAEARSAVLLVPSAVIPSERNVLLNPDHPEFARLVRAAPAPFSFDPRLFLRD